MGCGFESSRKAPDKNLQSAVQRRVRGLSTRRSVGKLFSLPKHHPVLKQSKPTSWSKAAPVLNLLVYVTQLVSFSYAPLPADGHILLNAPDLFWPPKLSRREPAQYWPRGLVGKCLGCCRLLVPSGTVGRFMFSCCWFLRLQSRLVWDAPLDVRFCKLASGGRYLVQIGSRSSHVFPTVV